MLLVYLSLGETIILITQNKPNYSRGDSNTSTSNYSYKKHTKKVELNRNIDDLAGYKLA